VFGDYLLAKQLARLEEEYRDGHVVDIGERLGQAVRARYDFVEAPALPHPDREGGSTCAPVQP
jgi:hypothetical protein